MARNRRVIRASDRLSHRAHRPAAAIRFGGLAAARPRASPGALFDGKSKIRARAPAFVAAEFSFLTLPHPSPSTDAAFHRESHQGRDACAGRGSPPRPQLRRHRAGTRTRLPPLPLHTPRRTVTGDDNPYRFLGQALSVVLPPRVAQRFATRADPSAHACRTDHAWPHRRRHRHRRQGAQVHGYVSSPRPPTIPPSPTFHDPRRPESRCLIHCRGV